MRGSKGRKEDQARRVKWLKKNVDGTDYLFLRRNYYRKEWALKIAKRMKAAGLYAKTTSTTDIAYAIGKHYVVKFGIPPREF